MNFGRTGCKIGAYSVTGVGQRFLSCAVAAVVFIGAAALSLCLAPGTRGMMGAALAALMFLIAVIDARRYIIPDELTIASFMLGLVHETIRHDGRVVSEQFINAIGNSILRALIVAALFWTLYEVYRWLRGREGLGFGDVKLAAVAGAWLSSTTIPVAIEVAALSALASYFIRQWIKGRSLRSGDRLPFGTFFAPAIWLGWLFEIISNEFI